MILPFIQIAGRWHIIVNWSPGIRPCKGLQTRPLNRKEVAWLEPELENALMDVWGRLFKDDAAIRDGARIVEDEYEN